MILMIDNYDSFTYNLVQYLKQIGKGVEVRRNDTIGIDEIGAMGPQAIVLSPGPGRPDRRPEAVHARKYGTSIGGPDVDRWVALMWELGAILGRSAAVDPCEVVTGCASRWPGESADVPVPRAGC